MAQDISDVLAFIHQYCDIYCMDKVLEIESSAACASRFSLWTSMFLVLVLV